MMAIDLAALRDDADEIEACGAGNEAARMREAADEIERLRAGLSAISTMKAASTCSAGVVADSFRKLAASTLAFKPV